MEDIILAENADLHHTIITNIDDIPDFYRFFKVRERWINIDHKSVVWSNTYNELSNANGWSDVFAVMNTSACTSRRSECVNGKASDIPAKRLREFIETFPTVVWLQLLTMGSGKDGPFRVLVAADRLNFVEEGIDLLKEEVGILRSSFERLRQLLRPVKLNKLIMNEVVTDNVAATLVSMYSEQMPSIKKIYTKRVLMTELRKPTICWGILRVLSYSILYLIDYTTKDWLNILNAREKTVRIPEHIIERIVRWAIIEDPHVPQELVDFLIHYSYPQQLAMIFERSDIDVDYIRDMNNSAISTTVYLENLRGVKTLPIVKTIINKIGDNSVVIARLIRDNITTLEDDALMFLAEFLNVNHILYEMYIVMQYNNNRDNNIRKFLNIPKIQLAINNVAGDDYSYYYKIVQRFFTSGRWRLSNDLLATIRSLISPLTIIRDMTIVETIINTLHKTGDYTMTKLRDILAIPVQDTLENRKITNRLFDEAIRRSDKQLPILLAKTNLVDAQKVDKLLRRLNLNSRDYKDLLKVSERSSPK